MKPSLFTDWQLVNGKDPYKCQAIKHPLFKCLLIRIVS